MLKSIDHEQFVDILYYFKKIGYPQYQDVKIAYWRMPTRENLYVKTDPDQNKQSAKNPGITLQLNLILPHLDFHNYPHSSNKIKFLCAVI